VNQVVSERFGDAQHTVALSTAASQKHFRLALMETIVAIYKRNHNTEWRTIRYVEWTPLFILKRYRLLDTPLAPCLPLLKSYGLGARATLGECMTLLGIDRNLMHLLFCACHGKTVSGADIAYRLNFYVDYHLRYR
jgi:hypothetical protein